jgi:hypothetical protein
MAAAAPSPPSPQVDAVRSKQPLMEGYRVIIDSIAGL